MTETVDLNIWTNAKGSSRITEEIK